MRGLVRRWASLRKERRRGCCDGIRQRVRMNPPEIRTGDWAGWRRCVTRELNPSGRLQERASLAGRDISLRLAAAFAVDRHIEHFLLAASEQVVQSVDFVTGVRKVPASAH